VNIPKKKAVLRCDNGVTGGNDKPPAGRKTCLQVAFLLAAADKSAFALLSTKVTKLMRRIRR
jgi:hypothetical protein